MEGADTLAGGLAAGGVIIVDGSSDASRREALFREVQRFRQSWLWILIIATTGFAWFAFIYELFNSLSPREGDGELWVAALVWALVGVGLPALFASARLVVEVRRDGLHYRYHPFHRGMHLIAAHEIHSAAARTYRPILEYGGWGIRGAWRKGTGKAYNVYGNRGLQLDLADGKKILFGSQRAEELASALNGVLEEAKHS